VAPKFKKLFQPSFFSKEWLIPVILGFVVLGIFLPIKPVFAQFNVVLDAILGGITLPLNAILAFIFVLILLLSTSFTWLAGVFLSWVLSPNFINLSYTNPAGNPIIEIGFNITQGLANIGIFLALVFIGLSTILRIREYQAQKTLPILIIIALLINFAPVICGLIVDAANIVMNYFLGSITEITSFANTFQSLGNIFSDALDWSIFKISKQIILILEINTLSIFSVVTGFILLVFAAIFFIRYVAIWILVILSPLAFVCRILKATQRYWNLWWTQLLQWSIIGIIGAFFLYIAGKISLLIRSVEVVNIPQGTIPGSHGVFEALLMLAVPVIFLFIGTILSFQTSAMGADVLMRGAKGFGRVAGTRLAGWAARTAWGKAKPWLRERVPERIKRAGERMAMAPTPGAGIPGLRGRLARGAAAPIWAIGRAIGRAAPGLIEAERKEIDEAEKRVTGRRMESQIAAFRGATSNQEKIGILNAMIKDKNIEAAIQRNLITGAEIGKLLEEASKRGRHETIAKSLPELAPFINPLIPPAEAIAGVVNKIKPEEVENVARGSYHHPLVRQAITHWWTGEHLRKIRDIDLIRELQAEFDRRGAEELANWNKEILQFLSTVGARRAGWQLPINLATGQRVTRAELRRLIERPYPPPPAGRPSPPSFPQPPP
jgi:hypothetical protein